MMEEQMVGLSVDIFLSVFRFRSGALGRRNAFFESAADPGNQAIQSGGLRRELRLIVKCDAMSTHITMRGGHNVILPT